MIAKGPVRDWLIAAGFAAVAVLFWRLRLIAPATQVHFVSGDLFVEHYPMADLAAEWMRAGSVPLWNPFQLCGQPFLASLIYGIFYPLNLFQLLLPTPLAFEVTLILHLLVAGVFMYLYGRVIQLGRPAAVTAGVVYMLSGFLICQAVWSPPAFAATAWVPVAFIGLEKIFAERRFGWAIVLGAAVGMPLLAGYPQSCTYLLYAVAGYASLRLAALLASPERAQVPHIVVLVAAGVLLGIALAAIQLLPTWELQQLGPRRGPLSVAQMLAFGLRSPKRMLAAAVDASPGYPRDTYIGILPLVLIPASLVSAAHRVRLIFLWALGLWSTAIAATVFTPLFAVYLWLPGASWFQAPSRMLLFYSFAGAALSGIGLQAITDNEGRPGHRRGAIAVASGVGLILALVCVAQRACLYLGLGLSLLWAAALFSKPRLCLLAAAAAVALIVSDLFIAVSSPVLHPYHSLQPLQSEHDVYDLIREGQGLYRTYISFPLSGVDYRGTPKQGTLHRIFSVTDYEPLIVSRYDKFFDLLEARPRAKRPASSSGYLELDPSAGRLRLLDLMGVRYIVARRSAAEFRRSLEAERWIPTYASQAGQLMIYENTFALARAYVAFSARMAAGEDEALAALSDPAFDARRAVVIESEDGALTGELGSADPTRSISGAHIVSYEANRVVLETDLDTPGWLVLTDTYYPGWKATVDGQRQKIYRANYLFRGVALRPGHHRIVFAYEPVSFRVGAGVSVCALLIVMSYVVWVIGSRRRSPGRLH